MGEFKMVSLKFCTPIYNRDVVIQKLHPLQTKEAIVIEELSLSCLQVTLLSSESEIEFLELLNTCLLESDAAVSI